jgi:hypothetical protein
VAAELLAHAAPTSAPRAGLTLIGDKGFVGQDFEELATVGFGMSLVRLDRRDKAPGTGRSAGSASGSSRSTASSKASST